MSRIILNQSLSPGVSNSPVTLLPVAIVPVVSAVLLKSSSGCSPIYPSPSKSIANCSSYPSLANCNLDFHLVPDVITPKRFVYQTLNKPDFLLVPSLNTAKPSPPSVLAIWVTSQFLEVRSLKVFPLRLLNVIADPF